MRDPRYVCFNLFLALIPVALGLAIGWLSSQDKNLNKKWYIWLPLVILWLGFLPNTCYLLTEWRHFIEAIIMTQGQIQQAPHDEVDMLNFLALSAFYVVYSGLGLITFSMALWPVARWLQPPRLAKFAFFMLCSLGVYLGLIKRLNTWDVLQKPMIVVWDAIAALDHPFTVAMIISFALVLWLNYWVFELFIDGLLLRVNKMNAEASKS